MRYYFFKTSLEDRNGDGRLENTLRALPGQTMEDGTPINEKTNVHAPKDAGKFKNGARLDYPEGTCFCSTSLHELDNLNGKPCKPFYTVYNDGETEPDFHPVGLTGYVKASHKSEVMEIAYSRFILTGSQETAEEPAPKKKLRKKVLTGPCDSSGKAYPTQETPFTPAYDDQVKKETWLIAQWMLKMMSDNGIRNFIKRPSDSEANVLLVDELYRSGESIDTIVSRKRFEAKCKAEKMDMQSLASMQDGPMKWYLDVILTEHRKSANCTAVDRDAEDPNDVADMANLLVKEMNNTYGTNSTPESIIPGVKKAIESGWKLNNIINPDVINAHDDVIATIKDIETGVIPAPVSASGTKTLFEQIADNKKLACPKAKDGFYVEKDLWQLLIRNMMVHQNTIITGPSGCGKTEIIQKLCEATGTPLTIISMGGVTDVTDHLVGSKDIEVVNSTPTTKFDWAEFALAIQRPGVVLLDEINRIPKGGSNVLFPVLDNRRVLPAYGAKSTDVREIRVHPDCTFFATANISKRGEYVNTEIIDEAIRTRMTGLVRLKYLPLEKEVEVLMAKTNIDKEDAKIIAQIAKDLRDMYNDESLSKTVSVRETLYTASLVRDGMSLEDALKYGILVHYDDGEEDPSSEWGMVKAEIATFFKN